MVQSVHAVADFAIQHPDEFKAWQKGSNYLCCLSCSKDRMDHLIDKLNLYGIKFTPFKEPDLENQLTAIAVESLPIKTHKKFFKNFKLGLS